MTAIIQTEFQKMRRHHILLIGMIGMLCAPLLQLFSQNIMTQEARRAYFDFAALMEVTVWGDAQIFMPVLFTLTGGYLINREYTDDTLKNIFTVPVSFRRLLMGKLMAIGLLAMLFGGYGFLTTVIVGLFARLPGLSGLVLIRGLVQMVGLSASIYIVVLPILAICGRRQGRFMGGSVAAFLLGYCVLFFKDGMLRNFYPFSAALTVIGFDTTSYVGAKEQSNLATGVISLGAMLLFAGIIVFTSGAPKDAKARRRRGKIARRGN